MLKKFSVVFAIICLLVFFSACNSNNNIEDEEKTSETQPTITQTTVPENNEQPDTLPNDNDIEQETLEPQEELEGSEVATEGITKDEESTTATENPTITQTTNPENDDKTEVEPEVEVETETSPNIEELPTDNIDKSEYEPDLFIEKVENISNDFINGVDASSLISLENSGVKYYDINGNEQDPLKTMAEAGVNALRIRIWNNPYDINNNGYGGGNSDLEKAIELGKRATENDMQVLINFHYSDFWADPAKQIAPKSWSKMSIEEKTVAIYDYTYTSLKQILDNGINVTMVQVGNETNNGMAGETEWKNITSLMNSAVSAIHSLNDEHNCDIKVAVHFTNPKKVGNYDSYAAILQKYKVEYDIFASSYYPFWHGTLDNLNNVLTSIKEKYNKDILIAEYSYAYTNENADAHPNSIEDGTTYDKRYPITVQGQSNAIRDIVNEAVQIGAIGAFYWEPAWLGVTGTYDEQLSIWNEFGSGWASKYSCEYDPDDAGIYFGGTSWDNQALFSNDGKPLDSLYTFNYLKDGLTTSVKIDFIADTAVTILKGDLLVIPEKIEAMYNNGDIKMVDVVWNEEEILCVNTALVGEYVISGIADGATAYAKITVLSRNYIENNSFEQTELSPWVIENINDVTTQLGVSTNASDALTNTNSFHFYSDNEVEFKIEQKVTNLPNGTYRLGAFLQGVDSNLNQSNVYIYAISNGEKVIAYTKIDGWKNWQNPEIMNISVTDGEIIVGAYVSLSENSWGTFDDFYLSLIE